MVDVESTPTQHAVEEYTRQADAQSRGTALCLSGGGYRAALFHLGALTRLNELGVLSQVETLSTVSGGSILAGCLTNLVDSWPEPGESVPGWEERVAEPLRAFTATDIRTRPLARRYLLPWNWFDPETAVKGLARGYYDGLTRKHLDQLPARPRFIFCATDVVFGVNWIFDTGGAVFAGGRVGDYEAGYVRPMPHVTVAQAVAASSCFPPMFDPMPMRRVAGRLEDGAYKKEDRDALVEGISLSDGGVYDNYGLEAVWKDHKVVLVSDGGGVFEGQQDLGLLWRLNRYIDIQGNQARAVRKRWLISNFISKQLAGTYWGIGSSADHYGYTGDLYSETLVDDVISEVRTDLDRFSEAEQSVLENHGYIMADAAIQRHAPELVKIPAPVSIPHPDWMDATLVSAALASSHKRRILGR